MTHSWNHMKPLFYRAFALIILIASCFTLIIAQQETGGITLALKSNLLLSEQLGMLGPVAISPYWGLFLASAASLFEVGGNEYLMTHPMLGNWLVFILFGLCAICTSIPNITKYSKALGVATSYLEDHVSMIIVILAVVLPIAHQTMGGTPTHGEFGIIDTSLYTLAMIAFSAVYMFIVTTVRLFFEVTAFITPIPFIDTVVEIMKKVSSLILMGIYFVSPEIALGISILILIVAFFIFRKANTTMNYFRQIYIAPIVSWIFRRKKALLDNGIVQRIQGNGINATIPVWPLEHYGKISKKKKTWLVEKEDGDLYLYQFKSFRRVDVQAIEKSSFAEGIRMKQDFNYLSISGNDSEKDQALKIRISREYFPHKNDLVRICKLVGEVEDEHPKEAQGKWWQNIKKYFSSKHLSIDTEISG